MCIQLSHVVESSLRQRIEILFHNARLLGFLVIAQLSPLRLCFLRHLQDISPERLEFFFKARLIEWVIAVGQSLSDICPVLGPQRGERGRKHNALLHGHVLPLVLDEVANDVIHRLAQDILVAQDALNRQGKPPQSGGAYAARSSLVSA
jgi:hypothetical protein